MNRAAETSAIIRIRFLGYWLSGTDRAQGRKSDVVPHLDDDGCPAMPMSQVKGQLKETALRLCESNTGGWTQDALNILFGRGGDDPDAVLDFNGEARLPVSAIEFITSNQELRTRLFRTIPATAIDEYGVADEHTYRNREVIVPVTLFGEINCKDPSLQLDWCKMIDHACAATMAFGKLKADGYGKSIASLEDMS